MSTSILFHDATIITFDDATKRIKIVAPGSLWVQDDRIAGIYDADTPVPADLPANTEKVDATGKIISPGFVDTHRHGWQTAFRSIAANTTLPEYFVRYGQYAALGAFTADDIYAGQLAGLYECLNAGVTTTLDHAHHCWDAATSKAGLDASIDSGLRVFWCYTFHDLPNGYDHAQQLQVAEQLRTDARLKTSPTEFGVAYDGWAMSPPETVASVVEYVTTKGVDVLTTHSLGGPWVLDHGPEVLEKHKVLNTPVPVVISHASFVSDKDVALLRSSNQYVSITPESEMHYGHDHEHNHEFLDQCALGVDTHFTFSTDMVQQARLWLQVTRRTLYREKLAQNTIGHPNPFDVEQAFYLATVAGGLALRRPDLGVIRTGAKADLVVFDGDSPNMLGFVDPVAAVLLHSNVGDVRHVLVDGRWRKKDGVLQPAANTGADWAATIKPTFLKSARGIQEQWAARPLPTIEDKFWGVTPHAVIDKVNVVRK
ncbi:chlorohydrolase family protein [Sporothrix brasiliensis 5110]|uniref:Chlorohydrolase family protein n=1 Tax=Sporothrix brasiliensis 5110 TaxID=1398154 RepID=A0A0C2F649_9PEZI|nr:chlorohydrolase family protein [Sporothrix brasiliensis 5110]KIH86488.1 chlorohydrolase family protein [Sporothrix brasiliensis 5110]